MKPVETSNTAGQIYSIYITDIRRSDLQYLVDVEFIENASNINKTTIKVGSAQVGRLLDEGIKAIDFSNGGAYPKPHSLVGWAKLHNGMLVSMDIPTREHLDQFMKALSQRYNTTKPQDRAGLGVTGRRYVYDICPKYLSTDKYLKGTMTGIIDGDTFKLKISEVGAKGIKFIDKNDPDNIMRELKVGEEISIRLAGVNCPETNKFDANEEFGSNTRNTKWLIEHQLDSKKPENHEKAFSIAEEGKRFTGSFIGREIVIEPDTYYKREYDPIRDTFDILAEGQWSTNNGEAIDPYGRVVGVAYAMMYPSEKITGYDSININRSLIANASETDPNFALAEPSEYVSSTGEIASIVNSRAWWVDAPDYEQKKAAIEQKIAEDSRSYKDEFLRRHGLILDKDNYIVYNDDKIKIGDTIYITRPSDTLSGLSSKFNIAPSDIISANPILKSQGVASDIISSEIPEGITLNIPCFFGKNSALYEGDKLNNANIVPADSENEEYLESRIDDRERLDDIGNVITDFTEYHLQIGDCTFMVPPLSIHIDTLSQNKRVQTLRSKSSIQIKSGYSQTMITVDLFFATLESINGYKYDNPTDPDNPYYRNGLRPLIAQFKKAPFLPIKNEFINNTHKVFSVALKDLDIQTIPGFPGCVQARLVLLPFDHTVYMPHEEWFDGTFCWPLYRWYYQQALLPYNIPENERQSDYHVKRPPMVDPRPNRIYLEPIRDLNSNIVFCLPDESVLAARKQAIEALYKKIDPAVYKDVNSAPGTIGADIALDGRLVGSGIAQYERFKETLRKYPMSKYPLLYNTRGVFMPPDRDTMGAKVMDLDLPSKEYYGAAALALLMYTYRHADGTLEEPIFIMNRAQSLFQLLEYVSNGVPPEFEGTITDGLHGITAGADEVAKILSTSGADSDELQSPSGGYMFLKLRAKQNQDRTTPANDQEGARIFDPENTSSIDKTRIDTYELTLALMQYERFKSAIAKYPQSNYPALYTSNGIFAPDWKNRNYDAGQNQKYANALIDIYVMTYKPNNEYPIKPLFAWNNAYESFSIFEFITQWPSITGEFDVRTECYEVSGRVTEAGMPGNVYPGGGFIILDMIWRPNTGERLAQGYYRIDAGDKPKLDGITQTAEAIELSYVNYKLEYEKLNYLAHMSEADIPAVEVPIGGLHVQSISASIHNTYAPLQLNGQPEPTYQFLGSSDSAMELRIKTIDRGAVSALRKLMADAQRITRDYNVAITSGVITIKNNVFSLLGTKSVLIERLTVETSGEDKESFNISISLVAFDKTQRMREDLSEVSIGDQIVSESLYDDNMMERFYEYSRRRRNQSGFEYTVVDFALRDIEVYPDLELPTYEEVNRILPKLRLKDGLGRSFTRLDNPDHAKFVDPDFYIRCDQTFRDYLYTTLEDGEPVVHLKDRLGFEAVEIGPSLDQQKGLGIMDSPNVKFSDEMMQWVQENLADIDVGKRIDVTATLGMYNANVVPEASKAYEADNSPAVGYVSPSSSGISGKITRENVQAPPTIEEWRRWRNIREDVDDDKVEQLIAGIKNPTGQELIEQLSYCVNNTFKNIKSAKDYTDNAEDDPTYKYGPTSISAPAITREKIINVMKALLELEYNWIQFDNVNGKLVPNWSNTNDIGLGQINAYVSDVIGKDDLDTARRTAWDWRFNVQQSVSAFACKWNSVRAQAKKRGRNDVLENPLDWTIIAYNQGEGGAMKYGVPNEVKYYNIVLSKLKTKYGLKEYAAATPTALYDKKVATSVGVAQNEYSDITKEIEQMRKYYEAQKGREPIAEIFKRVASDKAKEYYFVAGIKYNLEPPNFVGWAEKSDLVQVLIVDPLKRNEQFKKWQTDNKVVYNSTYDLYTLIIDRLKVRLEEDVTQGREPSFDGTKNYILVNSNAVELYDREYKSDSFVRYNKENRGGGIEYFKEAVADSLYTIRRLDSDEIVEDLSHVGVRRAIDPIVSEIVPSDVGVLFRSSFRDMLEYDMRGRLARAFPTFQMFIVDEGRWMQWHKLWDNFYGYNSIVSIDLMKDRRIAADTAVIEMTNIYHNLSTYDSETSYGEWDLTLGDLVWGTGRLLGSDAGSRGKVWNTIWDLPDKDILRARRDELNSMMLKAGARIHLRLGYTSNAYRLPVVFNGTITEMNLDDIVTVVAQGDGIELTNKLRVNPESTTDPGPFQGTKEPREFICEMLTSKGSWFENFIHKASGGVFYNQNPLGIVHFGISDMPTGSLIPLVKDFDIFQDFGEAGQNIYCGAGVNTMSQWIYTEGAKQGESIGLKWDLGVIPHFKGDEPNIKISLFDKTPWDILQVYAHCIPDYVATVVPFEFRSTAFFGKPWWGVIDKYDYKYRYDEIHDLFIREPKEYTRKALSQTRMYSSMTDIVANNIVATEQFMYTNVVGVYNEKKGAKRTKVVQADADIYDEKQKTAIVHLPLEAEWFVSNFYTQEKYAETAATSALRNYIKDMYQGELVVMGDPTVKPYDKMFISDTDTELSGMCEVKRVVHHFSMDTGFMTNITPDCISVIDDLRGLSMVTWQTFTMNSLAAFIIGVMDKSKMWRAVWGTPIGYALKRYGKSAAALIFNKVIADITDATPMEKAFLEMLGESTGEFIEQIGKIKGTGPSKSEAIVKAFKKKVQENFKDTAVKKADLIAKEAEVVRLKNMSSTQMSRAGMSRTQRNGVISKLNKEISEMKKAISAQDEAFEQVARFVYNIDTKDVNNLSSLNNILRKNSAYNQLDNVLFSKTASIFEKISDIIRNPGMVESEIDKLWKASGFLDKADILGEKGVWRGIGNKIFSGASGLTKWTAKVGGETAASTIRGTVAVTSKLATSSLLRSTVVGFAADIALTFITATLAEHYGRFLKRRQAVTIIPLKYRGKPFTAGINGHKGIIAGEAPSAVDKFLAGNGFGGGVVSSLYAFFGVNAPTYETTLPDAINDEYGGDIPQ